MTQVAIFVGPLIPDANPVFLEVFHIRVTFEKPQQLMDNRLKMELLGGQQRETILEIESHLITEHTPCAGTGTVSFLNPVIHYMLQQRQILLHLCILFKLF